MLTILRSMTSELCALLCNGLFFSPSRFCLWILMGTCLKNHKLSVSSSLGMVSKTRRLRLWLSVLFQEIYLWSSERISFDCYLLAQPLTQNANIFLSCRLLLPRPNDEWTKRYEAWQSWGESTNLSPTERPRSPKFTSQPCAHRIPFKKPDVACKKCLPSCR